MDYTSIVNDAKTWLKTLIREKECKRHACIMPPDKGSDYCDLHKCKKCPKGRLESSYHCYEHSHV